ncbi:unnamed protein product, partial [Urochloa humidicola]
PIHRRSHARASSKRRSTPPPRRNILSLRWLAILDLPRPPSSCPGVAESAERGSIRTLSWFPLLSGYHEEVGVDRPRREGARQVARRAGNSSFQQFMNYSSGHGGDPNANGNSTAARIASDRGTHQDFKPMSKSSDTSLDDIVAQDIKENPVLIYMKGFPESPMCGFSALAVKVFQQYDVPICGRDILGDLRLKEAVKAHTNWPTFPQVFINGEFVGGSDIILSMHQKGELKDLLGDIAQRHGQKADANEP